MENYYSITAATWRPDGAQFITANSCGSVDVFDVSVRKMKFKGKFELNYLSGSKIRVKSLERGNETLIESMRGLEITKLDVLKERFVVAETASTLILGDLQRESFSEVEWNGSGNESFEFAEQGLCWISNAGEVSVVEFGVHDILGTFRTEFVN